MKEQTKKMKFRQLRQIHLTPEDGAVYPHIMIDITKKQYRAMIYHSDDEKDTYLMCSRENESLPQFRKRVIRSATKYGGMTPEERRRHTAVLD